MVRLTLAFFSIFLFSSYAVYAETIESYEPQFSIAMHGDTKYADDFNHFDYVNPDAPKGGTLRLSGPETFDSFNQFIPKGVAAQGLGLMYVSLLEKSQDEPFSMYPALAESLMVAEDRSWVIFKIRDIAKWHDGTSITAEDIVWTFNTFITDGNPFFRAYYAAVEKAESLSPSFVKFTFNQEGNRELPMIVGEMPVLPKHYWTTNDRYFTETTLTPPLGGGPYKIGTFSAGSKMTYTRVNEWWGKDLPVFKGRYNFDTITYDYYRDQNISLEALFADEYDFRQEYTAKLWATAYDAPPVKDGRIKKELIENSLPQGMQAFAFNLRRDVFKDKAVRQAINYAFDFEWSNKQFAYDAYTRSRSYFENSDMAATGLPEGRELEILMEFEDQLPVSVFNEEYNPSLTDGSGNNRQNLRKALEILKNAGYTVMKDGVRHHAETGEALEFELLFSNINAAFERWFQPFRQNLERLGVKATIRIVDASQYVNRVLEYDYDMIVSSWGQSNSPGNEQREYWGSEKVDIPGSRNYIGVKDPVVDALIDMIVTAPTREELVFRTRALDRVIQHGWYVVPNWHIAAWRVAYWDRFEKPETQAPYSLGVVDTWWAKD